MILQLGLLAADLRRRAADRRRPSPWRRLPQARERRRAAGRRASTGSASPIAALGFGGLVYGLSEFASGDRLRPTLHRGRRRGRDRRLRLPPAVAAAHRRAAAGPARPAAPHLHGSSLILMSVAFMAMLGSMILLPLYLQNVRGLSPAGDRPARDARRPGDGPARPAGRRAVRQVRRAGAGHPRRDRDRARASFALTQIGADTPYWQILVVHIAADGQPGRAVHAGVHARAWATCRRTLYSHGSSMLGTIQQVAGAFGTALVITLMTSRADSPARRGRQRCRRPPRRHAAGVPGRRRDRAWRSSCWPPMLPNRRGRGPARRSDADGELGDLDAELEELEDGLERAQPRPDRQLTAPTSTIRSWVRALAAT